MNLERPARAGTIARPGALCIALACLATPGALRAQQCAADHTTFFEWNSIHLAVVATDSDGVELRAITSRIMYQGTPHEFFGRFDPDSAAAWVAAATQVAEAGGRPDSGARALATPALRSDDSSYVIVRREAKGRHWRDEVEITMVAARDSGGFRLIASPADADTLFRALFSRAIQSGMFARHDTARPMLITQLDTPPKVAHAGAVSYPMVADGRFMSGEVVAEFVVGVDGRPDMSTFCAIASDAPEFTSAARNAVQRTRFTPGILHSVPVRVHVVQNVEFHRPRP